MSYAVFNGQLYIKYFYNMQNQTNTKGFPLPPFSFISSLFLCTIQPFAFSLYLPFFYFFFQLKLLQRSLQLFSYMMQSLEVQEVILGDFIPLEKEKSYFCNSKHNLYLTEYQIYSYCLEPRKIEQWNCFNNTIQDSFILPLCACILLSSRMVNVFLGKELITKIYYGISH